MSYQNGRQYTDFRGINLKAINGVLRFEDVDSAPTSATGEYLLYVDGGTLYFDNGSSATAVGAAGGAGSSLDGAYDVGRTITVNSGAVTLNGVNEDTAVLSINGDGDSGGALIAFAHTTATRNDLLGTASSWAITGQGNASFLSAITPTLVAASAGNVNLAIDAAGTGTIGIGATSTGAVTITPALTATTSVTVTGSEGSNVLTVTAGDVVVSDGSLALTDDDNAESVTIINNTATTIGAAASAAVVQIESTSLTTGAALNVQLTEGTLNGGFYYSAWDATAGARVFSVGEDGVVVSTGTAGANSWTLSNGDILVSDGSLTMTDADNAASLSITNNTATTANTFLFTGSGVFTGTGASAFFNVTQSGATTGDVAAVIANGLTSGTALLLSSTGTVAGTGALLEVVADSATTAGANAGEGIVRVSADGLTTGTALDITSTAGNALTTGRLADFSHVSGNITGTLNKTAQMFNVESSRTVTTGTVADDFDMGSFIRTSVINGAGAFTSTGSVVYIENAVTNTSGTVTDTVIGLELVMDSLGTGDGVKITHAATAGKALNIVGAATSVSDVLITGSGVKADNKASLEVTNSGATAAGGSVLRATNTGTPAAATSYLVDFDYSGATMTNNPVTVFINSKDSTGAGLQVTGSGAPTTGNIQIASTATGALGAVMNFDQTANSAAANDVIGRLLFTAQDDANAAETYGRIDCVLQDATAANPDASLNFLVDRAGTVTLALTVGWDDTAGAALNGISVGDASGAGIVSSNGATNLTLNTNGGTNSGTITITQGANAAITLTPNGTGMVDIAGKVVMSETTTSSGAGAVSVNGAIHEITTTAADALTLADGTEGQVLHVVMVTDGGDGTLTPTNLAGAATTITFDAVGDAVTLLFTNGTWFVVGNNGCVIA